MYEVSTQFLIDAYQVARIDAIAVEDGTLNDGARIWIVDFAGRICRSDLTF